MRSAISCHTRKRFGVCMLLLALTMLTGANQLFAYVDGSLVCWGGNWNSQANVPAGNDFVAVAAGSFHSLAVRADGSLVSWDRYGQTNGPAGNFMAVAARIGHSLAVRADGSLVGWGSNRYGETNVPAGNDFVAVAAGNHHSLALRADGSLVGWGYNVYGQTNVPAGNDFVAVAAGFFHSLALRANGSLVGWGRNEVGQTNVPAGNDFVAVSAGYYHNVALRADGSLAGWGWNGYGQTNVPAGNDFVTIAAGGYHNLAVRADGSLVGWGSNMYGGTNVPAGNAFVAVAAGFDHSLVIATTKNPIADAGPDQTIEYTGALTEVQLDGTGSSDPDSDELTYEWSVADESGAVISDVTNSAPTGLFPIGPTLVTLTLSDGKGGIAIDDVLITISDNSPPVVVCTTDKISIWPSDHCMVDVTIYLQVSDNCVLPEDLVVNCRVSSSEPDDASGDGSFAGDVNGKDGFIQPVDVDLTYDDLLGYVGTVSLRAERDGSQAGRKYSVTSNVIDLSGNAAMASCVVVVPHDRRKM